MPSRKKTHDSLHIPNMTAAAPHHFSQIPDQGLNCFQHKQRHERNKLKRIVTVTSVVRVLGYEIMDSSFCNQANSLQCIFTCCFWQLTNLPQLQQIEHRLARMHARSIHSQACTHLAQTCITNLSFYKSNNT